MKTSLFSFEIPLTDNELIKARKLSNAQLRNAIQYAIERKACIEEDAILRREEHARLKQKHFEETGEKLHL